MTRKRRMERPRPRVKTRKAKRSCPAPVAGALVDAAQVAPLGAVALERAPVPVPRAREPVAERVEAALVAAAARWAAVARWAALRADGPAAARAPVPPVRDRPAGALVAA